MGLRYRWMATSLSPYLFWTCLSLWFLSVSSCTGFLSGLSPACVCAAVHSQLSSFLFVHLSLSVWCHWNLVSTPCPHPVSPTSLSSTGYAYQQRWFLVASWSRSWVCLPTQVCVFSSFHPWKISVCASSCWLLSQDSKGSELRFVFPPLPRPWGAGSLWDELTKPDPDRGQ